MVNLNMPSLLFSFSPSLEIADRRARLSSRNATLKEHIIASGQMTFMISRLHLPGEVADAMISPLLFRKFIFYPVMALSAYLQVMGPPYLHRCRPYKIMCSCRYRKENEGWYEVQAHLSSLSRSHVRQMKHPVCSVVQQLPPFLWTSCLRFPDRPDYVPYPVCSCITTLWLFFPEGRAGISRISPRSVC